MIAFVKINIFFVFWKIKELVTTTKNQQQPPFTKKKKYIIIIDIYK